MASLTRWFAEQVWPNLVASALWAWPALAYHHLHVRRRLAHIQRQVSGDAGPPPP